MTDDGKKPKDEWAFLGRGIARTFKRDLAATTFGVILGAVLGFLGSFVLGFSVGFGIKFGALLGAFIGLASRSFTSRLFDYEREDSN